MSTTTYTAKITTETLTTQTREALARMAHGASVPTSTISVAALEVLRERGLVTEHTEGQVAAHACAAGYAAAPGTFEP